MGRRPAVIPWHQWKITLPADLAGRVEFLLADPLTNKAKYGARSELVKSLLEDWVSRQETQVSQ